ncbi:MAG: hypothetical protein QOD63_1493 [Actinomycetota bacterium]|jgi:hypothetical protein|nr:hypothetical protein [Actinomycetota bacterium]
MGAHGGGGYGTAIPAGTYASTTTPGVAMVAADATKVPTLIELIGNAAVLPPGVNIAGTESLAVFTAPFPLKITQVSLAMKPTIAASDTDYWEVRLRKAVAGSQNTIASKFTNVTAGQAVASYVDWNFDNVTFANNTFAKGDVFNIAFFLTGSSTSKVWSYLAVTFRYEPV